MMSFKEFCKQADGKKGKKLSDERREIRRHKIAEQIKLLEQKINNLRKGGAIEESQHNNR